MKLIRQVSGPLTQKSKLSLLLDHQKVLQPHNETNKDALGIALLLTANHGKRYTYLVCFETVDSTSNDDTVRIAKLVPEESVYLVYTIKKF